MFYVFLALSGILSGTLGGMGMGGGTLLIPLLTLLFGFNQKVVQGINLISFSIMAIIILIVHFKNRLIDIKSGAVFAGLSIITAILGAILVSKIDVKYLKVCFGLLLIGIAVYQIIIELRKIFNKGRVSKIHK